MTYCCIICNYDLSRRFLFGNSGRKSNHLNFCSDNFKVESQNFYTITFLSGLTNCKAKVKYLQ